MQFATITWVDWAIVASQFGVYLSDRIEISMRVLFVSPTPTHPQNAGNRARVYRLAAAVRQMGHDVHFAFIRREHGDERAMRDWWGDRFHAIDYTEPTARNGPQRLAGQLLGRWLPGLEHNLPIDAWFDTSNLTALRQIQEAHRFEVVIVEYVFMSLAFSAFGGDVLKIVDTHDVFTDRYKIFLQSGRKPDWFSASRDEEAAGLRRADAVIAIQDQEREFFERISGVRTATIGHLVDTQGLYDDPEVRGDCPQAPTMLFVGSGNPVNVDSVRHFIDNTLPLIKRRVPDIEFLLAGRICNAFRPQPGIRHLGELDDLAAAYRAATLVVAPMRFGTGLNIKVIEALGHGMPLVTTSNGVKGISMQAAPFLVADTGPDFAAEVEKLVADSRLRSTLSANAQQFAVAWNRDFLQALQQLVQPLASRPT